jgi:hypothetical protein
MVFALLLAAAFPAQANHASTDFFDTQEGTRWVDTWHPDICLPQEWAIALGDTELTNAVNAMYAAINEWQGSTDVSSTGSTITTSCGQYNALNDLHDGDSRTKNCNEMPAAHPDDTIQFEPMGLGGGGITPYAETLTCDYNNNGKIDWFVIVVNSSIEDQWHYNGFTDPTLAKPVDLRGVITHEFGHVLGWDGPNSGHLTSDCSHVPADWNTMCAIAWGATKGDDGSDGTHERSLESHDIGETNDNY